MTPRTQTRPLDEKAMWRQHEEDSLSVLRDTPISNVGEVLEIARARFGPVEDPVTPPPLPGRDPMVKRGTDKALFFGGAWRQT